MQWYNAVFIIELVTLIFLSGVEIKNWKEKIDKKLLIQAEMNIFALELISHTIGLH